MTAAERPSGAEAKTASVDSYMAKLDHPHRTGVETLRRAILELDPHIREEVKWNAPSFKLEDHFATFRLHPVPMFQLVLHTGAKAKTPAGQVHLDDPDQLVKWVAKDRCYISFASDADAAAKLEPVLRFVRSWIDQL